MSDLVKEHFFNCPYCKASISVLVDLPAGSQTYIEDCEVCCNPLSIAVEISEMELVDFRAEAVEQ